MCYSVLHAYTVTRRCAQQRCRGTCSASSGNVATSLSPDDAPPASKPVPPVGCCKAQMAGNPAHGNLMLAIARCGSTCRQHRTSVTLCNSYVCIIQQRLLRNYIITGTAVKGPVDDWQTSSRPCFLRNLTSALLLQMSHIQLALRILGPQGINHCMQTLTSIAAPVSLTKQYNWRTTLALTMSLTEYFITADSSPAAAFAAAAAADL